MSIPGVKHLLNLGQRAVKWDGFWWISGVVAVLAVGGLFSWCFWEELRGENESLSTTIRNLGLIIGGVIAIILAVWRSRVAEKQANTALRQAETAQLQAETAQQSLLNERHQRGVEMLGSSILAVRLGGIYELRRLAEQYPEQYHVQVMESFCAFVRNPVEDNGTRGLTPIRTDPPHGQPPPLREDVQAIMDAIAVRNDVHLAIEKEARFRLNLRGSDLRGAMLMGANLASAEWQSSSGQSLAVSLSISGRTDLSEAKLCSAHLAVAQMQRAMLTGACLCRAGVPWTDLSESILASANLHEALSWGPILSGANFSVDGKWPAKGIMQSDLDSCHSALDNPPTIPDGMVDIETGEQLVWRGKPLDGGQP